MSLIDRRHVYARRTEGVVDSTQDVIAELACARHRGAVLGDESGDFPFCRHAVRLHQPWRWPVGFPHRSGGGRAG